MRRYRAALRCARLRREGAPPERALGRWRWLYPRVVAGAVGVGIAVVEARAPLPVPASAPPTICVPPPPGPEDAPIVVLVSKTQILVGEDPTPVVRLPPRDELVQGGLDAKYKRGGPQGMLVVPLAEALARAIEAEAPRVARRHVQGDEQPLEAIVIADGTTPYRLFVEVLFTVTESGLGKYHLMVFAPRRPRKN